MNNKFKKIADLGREKAKKVLEKTAYFDKVTRIFLAI